MDREEKKFRKWFEDNAKKNKTNPNPDDPRHFYDARGAFRSGAQLNEEGHLPSQFKKWGHPRRFINGVDTVTGLPEEPGDREINDAINFLVNAQMGTR